MRCSAQSRFLLSEEMRSQCPTYLEEILYKVAPNWKVVPAQELTKRINREGLAGEYAKLRADYELSDILDGGTLRKIAAAIGVRYVFQPRLAAFS